MNSRLVYSTDWTEQTVTIDYNQSLHLFLTDKEQHRFSAERLLRMLNGWAKIDQIEITAVGRVHISTGRSARCILTPQAITTLSRLYLQRQDWQIEYPFFKSVLAKV